MGFGEDLRLRESVLQSLLQEPSLAMKEWGVSWWHRQTAQAQGLGCLCSQPSWTLDGLCDGMPFWTKRVCWILESWQVDRNAELKFVASTNNEGSREKDCSVQPCVLRRTRMSQAKRGNPRLAARRQERHTRVERIIIDRGIGSISKISRIVG